MSVAPPSRIIIAPQPGYQTEFLSRPETEVLYAGEAGGGKSFALLLDALRYIHERDYKAIIFRRTFPDLGHLIQEAMEIYKPLGADYKEQNHSFVFPSGAMIRFSHLQHTKNIYDHQGQQYDFIGFDELPQFPKLAYVYLFSRLRGKNPNIKRYMRGTGNPDGEHLLWVKARFIDCLEPLKPKWFLTAGDRDTEVPAGTNGAISRCFVPSIRSENMALMGNDPDYESRLNQLPEAQKRALKFGLWDYLDKPFQLIKTAWWQRALNGGVPHKPGLNAIGADYAESGDKAVMLAGTGNRVLKVQEWPGMKTTEFGQILYKEHMERGRYQCVTGVDAVGPGVGAYHTLQELGIGDRVDPCTHKDPSFDAKYLKLAIKLHFDCWRSQAWWKLKEDLENGEIDLSALQSEEGYYDNLHMLQEEILAHTYEVRNGFLRVTSKDELRKADSIGRSPDRADALVIWNWVRTRPPESFQADPDDGDYGGFRVGNEGASEEAGAWV